MEFTGPHSNIGVVLEQQFLFESSSSSAIIIANFITLPMRKNRGRGEGIPWAVTCHKREWGHNLTPFPNLRLCPPPPWG